MKTPLKIAIYSGEIPSTTFIERLISGVAHAGHSVILFGILRKRPSYSSRVRVVGYRLNRLSKFWHLMRYGILLTLFKGGDKKRLDTYLKQQQKTDVYTKVKYYPVLWYQPDVFHLQWAKGLKDWIWVQDFGMKLVLSLRGAHINYSPIADAALAAMYQAYFPKVDGFHAVSGAIGLEAQKYGAAQNKITVVYSGLPASEIQTGIDKKPEPLGLPDKPLDIISVGRPHWVKGYSYALDACKILQAQGFDFHYTIIGGAKDIELAYQVHDLHLSKQVTLLNPLPYPQVQELIAQADLLLLPSIKEGIANVVLEAMALGTLVLSTDCGGMDEVVHDGETGFLVPIRDSQAMAAKIIEIANLSETETVRIREHGLEVIKTNHREEQMVQGMIGLYHGLFEE
ncbi:glycosyltransferase family 4 protein [Bizionia sp.]|uniref:glycosyltransferase family 4 protein n=1 Tax=Bizionia sp. TaxID=1954480 RepID=UPI003A94AB91